MKDHADGNTTELLSGGLKVGYARVSTADQNLALQVDALKAARLHQDLRGTRQRQADGSSRPGSRPEGAQKAGHVGRMAFGSPGQITASLGVTSVEAQGVFFEPLTEEIDTRSATGRLVFHFFAALADFERNLIS